MNRRLLGALLLGLITVAAGCRDIWGFHEPLLISGTGGTGAGGDTGASGGTGGCMSPSDCGPTGQDCVVATCNSGVCGTANAAEGTKTSQQTKGDCKQSVCNGAGATKMINDDTDVGNDGNDCTFDVCNAGTPGTVLKDEGTLCQQGYCDATGKCVECTKPEHCASFVCLPDGTCKDPTCDDNVQNGDEVGVDCGGTTCPVCGDCMGVEACPIWAQHYGDPKDQQIRSLTVDVGGKLVVTGDIAGTVSFGAVQLAATASADIFVTKFDTAGGVLWAKSFGDINPQYGRSVATDLFGNVFAAGEASGTVDFGGGALTANFYDGYVVKLDPNGGYLWAKLFGAAGNQRIFGTATDIDNNVIVVGSFEQNIDFGGGALTSAGFEDVFIAKLDPNGNEIWSKRYGETGDQRALAVVTDLQKNVYVTGWFKGAIDFGMGPVTSAGGEDGFLVKLGSAGNVIWSRTFGDAADQRAQALTLDSSGNPLMVGYFGGSMAVTGGPTLTSAGNHDIFLVKLNALGNHQLSKSYGTMGQQEATAVVGDSTGSMVLAGNFEGTVDFGGGPLISAGGTDIFVTKLEADGTHKWSLRFGDGNIQYFAAAATNSMNQVFLGGTYTGSIDLGLGPLPSSGGLDIFLAKIGP